MVSASAIYSYFHKTPFPQDFGLIVVCMVIYYSATGAAYALKYFVTKDWFITYYTNFKKAENATVMNDEAKKLTESFKKELEGASLKVGSKLPMFSEFYCIFLEIKLANGKVLTVK